MFWDGRARGGERGAVAESGEVVDEPPRVVGGHARSPDARDDEERQQRGEGFGAHGLRLHEGQVADDAGQSRACADQIAHEHLRADDAVGDVEDQEGGQERGGRVHHRERTRLPGAADGGEPAVAQRERAGAFDVSATERDDAAGCDDAGADGEQSLADLPDRRCQRHVQRHGRAAQNRADQA